jgi:hypothetical protein
VSQLKKIDLPENLSGRAVFVTTVKERCWAWKQGERVIKFNIPSWISCNQLLTATVRLMSHRFIMSLLSNSWKKQWFIDLNGNGKAIPILSILQDRGKFFVNPNDEFMKSSNWRKFV